MARPSADGALLVDGETASPAYWPLRSYLELAALPTAVPCARLHTKNILYEWRMAHLTDTVELLVSEIVTNAVRASADQAYHQALSTPTVRFWLTSDGSRILIQVWDSDPNTPAPQTVELDAESGRGLLLIETLSTQWGSYIPDNRHGKIVWAVCAADAQDPHLRRPRCGRPVLPVDCEIEERIATQACAYS